MSLAEILTEQEVSRNFNTLIIVGGHALYVGPDPNSEDSWRGGFPEEGKFYREHADQAVRMAARIPESLLIFSGGPTRRDAVLAESQSYFNLQEQLGWNGHYDVRERTATEKRARDSLENLRFSIDLFRDYVEQDPFRVYVLGWEFKRTRVEMHASVLGLQNFEYIGVNNPPGSLEDETSPLAVAVRKEQETVELFRRFPSGNCDELEAKRRARNPHLLIRTGTDGYGTTDHYHRVHAARSTRHRMKFY